MVAPPAGETLSSLFPPRRPPPAGSQAGLRIEPGQDGGDDHRRARREPSSARRKRVHGLDQQIAATFRRHHQAMTIESMPGFRPIPAPSSPVAAGDLRAYPSAATWPPQPAWCQSPTTPADDPATCTSRAVTADSCGTVDSTQTSMMRAGPNRAYLKKRAGCTHAPPSSPSPAAASTLPLGPPTTTAPSASTRPASLLRPTTSLRFPMARHRSIFYLGGTFANGDHVLDPLQPLTGPPARFRNARPVRKCLVSSQFNAPRPCTYKDW